MNEIQRSISPIIKGYTIYLITSIATLIIATAMAFSLIASGIKSHLASNYLNFFALFSGLIVYLIIFLAAVVVMIYGMYLVYKGLKDFGPKLDSIGAMAVNYLSISMLISIISSIVSLIPLGNILAVCGSIASIVLSFIGYSALRKSASLNEEGKAAAQKLFQSMIFMVITIGCVLIPFLGWAAMPVLYILYWIYLLRGWMMMRDSFVTKGCEVPNALSDHQ